MPESKTNALAKASVQERKQLEQALVVTDEQGHRMLAIPPSLAENYNVFAPAAVLTQGDSFFAPAFTVVHLDKESDYYPMERDRDGKPKPNSPWAMSKNGILKIANAAGIDFSQDPGGRETGEALPISLFGQHIMVMRTYTYTSIGRFRRSDGTFVAMKAEKEWHPQAVALEKEMEASAKSFLKSDAERIKYAKKEFLRSLETRSMMMKSKAQNAVMRHAFSIKQKFTIDEIAKPGFVVGYNLDAGSDPNALAIVASLVGADVENLYGKAAPELPGGYETVTMADGDVLTVDVETGEYDGAEDAGTPEVVDADASDEESLFPESDSFAFVDEASPSNNVPDEKTAGMYTFDQGPMAGKTIMELYHNAAGRAWLVKVRNGFQRLANEETINTKQADALRHIEAYFTYQG